MHLRREKQYEGKYLIQTDQTDMAPAEAVTAYKQLNDVERGFVHLIDNGDGSWTNVGFTPPPGA